MTVLVYTLVLDGTQRQKTNFIFNQNRAVVMGFKYFIVLLFLLNSCLAYSGCFLNDENKELSKKKVDLSGKDLLNEDFSLFDSEILEILILDSCNLNELPSVLQSFSNLRHLSLRYNENLDLLQAVSILEKLEKLTFLNLSNNDIINIPQSFSKLKNLTGLRLSFNNIEIENTAAILSKMPKLRRLWIDNNQIKTFSPLLLTFPKLRFLYAFDNDIKQLSLPEKQSGKLCVLHLGSNQFHELPIELIDMKNLRMAMFNKNRIESISNNFNEKKYSMAALILDANPLGKKEKEKADKMFRKFMMYSSNPIVQ